MANRDADLFTAVAHQRFEQTPECLYCITRWGSRDDGAITPLEAQILSTVWTFIRQRDG